MATVGVKELSLKLIGCYLVGLYTLLIFWEFSAHILSKNTKT